MVCGVVGRRGTGGAVNRTERARGVWVELSGAVPISMMHVNINVEYARVITEQLKDG